MLITRTLTKSITTFSTITSSSVFSVHRISFSDTFLIYYRKTKMNSGFRESQVYLVGLSAAHRPHGYNTNTWLIIFLFVCLFVWLDFMPDVIISVHSPNSHFQVMTAAVATRFLRKATATTNCQMLLNCC